MADLDLKKIYGKFFDESGNMKESGKSIVKEGMKGINKASLEKYVSKAPAIKAFDEATKAGPKQYATKSRNTDSFDTKLKRQQAGITDPKTGKYTGMFDKIATSKNLETMGKVARASTYGKIALGVAGAGLAAKEYLKSKMKKKESPDDEMNEKPESKRGGGMMKYSKGSMVVSRGNKLARSKPTKMC